AAGAAVGSIPGAVIGAGTVATKVFWDGFAARAKKELKDIEKQMMLNLRAEEAAESQRKEIRDRAKIRESATQNQLKAEKKLIALEEKRELIKINIQELVNKGLN